jgi:hypothetical protein
VTSDPRFGPRSGIPACVALLLLAAATASAQSTHHLRVTVPFPFVAAGTNCPAGDYTVDIDRHTSLVTLSSRPNSILFLTINDPWPAQRDRSYLRFRHFGERWVLQEIVALGNVQQLNVSKLETEYAQAKVEEKIVAVTVNK